MKVNIKCFSSLSDQFDCRYDKEVPIELEQGDTVHGAIEKMRIPDRKVKITFLNNQIVDIDRPLKDGDRLTLVPATGGM